MPIYDYLCPNGHRFEEWFSIHEASTHTPCRTCGSIASKAIVRFPGVSYGMIRETQFNTSVGKVVSSDAEFRSELARQSDELSERNGFPVNFQPIDGREAHDHLGVTDEGMDSTYAAQVESGEREVIRHL